MKVTPFKTRHRSIATALMAVFALSVFMPITNAGPVNDNDPNPSSNPAISNLSMLPASPYNVNSNEQVKFKYKISGLGSGVNATMTSKVIHDGQERTLENGVSHPDGDYEVTWDGKLPAGMKPGNDTDYFFQVSGTYGGGNGQFATAFPIKSIQFEVKAQNPTFTASVDTPTYNTTTDNDGLKCNFVLSNLYESDKAHMKVSIMKDSTLVKLFDYTPYGNGPNGVTWDGKAVNAAEGSYKCKVEGKWNVPGNDTSLGIEMTPVEVPFTVTKTSIVLNPAITAVTVGENPYNYSNNNNVDLTYSYVNFLNKDIAAAVYAKDNDNNAANDTEIYKWPTVTNPGTGSKTLPWNGKNSSAAYVVDGNYYFKVWSPSDSGIAAKQVDFEVKTTVNPASAPAITNLKANPSTFSPDGDGANDSTVISFDLSQTADVTILIGSGAPYGVATEIHKGSKNAGTVNFTWNGKEGSSAYSNGTWPIVVQAKNSNGTDEEKINVTISSKIADNCGGFTDVPADLCPAFKFAKDKGIFLGDDNSTKVRPYDVINRVESAAVMLRTFDMTMYSASGNNEGFNDVNTTQSYMTSGTVRSAKMHGILKGYPDGSLKPAQQVINAELLTMFGRASGKTFPTVQSAPFLDTPMNAGTAWYLPYVNGAKLWGWIGAGSYFNPNQGMTRGNVAKLIYDANKAGLSIPGVK